MVSFMTLACVDHDVGKKTPIFLYDITYTCDRIIYLCSHEEHVHIRHALNMRNTTLSKYVTTIAKEFQRYVLSYGYKCTYTYDGGGIRI